MADENISFTVYGKQKQKKNSWLIPDIKLQIPVVSLFVHLSWLSVPVVAYYKVETKTLGDFQFFDQGLSTGSQHLIHSDEMVVHPKTGGAFAHTLYHMALHVLHWPGIYSE